MGETADDGGAVAAGGGFDSGGDEEILLHVVFEGLPGDSLENGGEQLEVGDGPVPLGSGFVGPLPVGEEGDDLVEGFGLAVGGFEGVAEVVIVDDAGGVAEELADGDVMALKREVGEKLGDVVVEGELAAFDLLHDGDSGEREHGADDVIDGIGWCGRFKTEVGEAIAFFEEDFVASRDEDRGADDVVLRDDSFGDGV